MNPFKEKLYLLYVPYLLICLGFIASYTGLHWLLLIHWKLSTIRPVVIDIILPLCFSLIPVLVWYRRRVKIIRFGHNYKDGFVFQVFVWAAIALPSLLAQLYLEATNGGIEKVAAVPIEIMPYFQANMGYGLYWLLGSLAIGAGLVLFFLFFIGLDEWEFMRYKKGLKSASDHELNDFLGFFVPKPDYFVTPIVMNANILVFLAMVFCGLGFKHFHTRDLLNWGGNLRPLVASGEVWRLVTGTFLHGGVMHLLSNMVGMVFVGTLVEPVLGRSKFAITYLLTGIIASLASLWVHEATVSVGASGAIFGLYGIFVALLVTKVFPKDFRRQFLRMTIIFIGYNLAMGYSGNIDNAAHIGGLISGILIGVAFAPGLKAAKAEQARKEYEQQQIFRETGSY